jgi:hypothetical protein
MKAVPNSPTYPSYAQAFDLLATLVAVVRRCDGCVTTHHRRFGAEQLFL